MVKPGDKSPSKKRPVGTMKSIAKKEGTGG